MSENGLAKIAITLQADSALDQAQARINQNFEGGRVTKAELASWLIARAAGELGDADIEEVRRTFFNQVVYLETLLKKLKSSHRNNLAPEEMATLQTVLTQQAKRKPRQAKAEEPQSDSGIGPRK